MTTYYPAPTAAYNIIKLDTNASLTCNGTNNGTVAADSTGTLYICSNNQAVLYGQASYNTFCSFDPTNLADPNGTNTCSSFISNPCPPGFTQVAPGNMNPGYDTFKISTHTSVMSMICSNNSVSCNPDYCGNCNGGVTAGTYGCNGSLPACGTKAGSDSCGASCTINSGLTCGCFVSGTKVLLANGKRVAIQRLKVGDILLGSGGAHNRIVKFNIMPKQDRMIYSFNGGRYFVTGNHAFKTTTGWKAIDPKIARLENPQLNITQLNIGDILITIKGLVPLKRIKSKMIKNSVVYSPELDAGSGREYYADGFLVHNKPSCNAPDMLCGSTCISGSSCVPNYTCTCTSGPCTCTSGA